MQGKRYMSFYCHAIIGTQARSSSSTHHIRGIIVRTGPPNFKTVCEYAACSVFA